jgi:hypothetical protein
VTTNEFLAALAGLKATRKWRVLTSGLIRTDWQIEQRGKDWNQCPLTALASHQSGKLFLLRDAQAAGTTLGLTETDVSALSLAADEREKDALTTEEWTLRQALLQQLGLVDTHSTERENHRPS